MTSGIKNRALISALKRHFWERMNCNTDVYSNLEEKELFIEEEKENKYLFHVILRAKHIFGIVKAESVKEASCIVTGRLAWAIKDLLS